MTKTQFIPTTETVKKYTEELCEVLGQALYQVQYRFTREDVS